MGRVLGLLVVAMIVLVSYKLYFSHLQQATGAAGESAGASGPAQVIDSVGAKNDLIAISRAETTYRAQGSSYATFDQLVSQGFLQMTKSGRPGYSYDLESSENEFRAYARCSPPASGCISWMIDQTQQLKPAP